MASARASPTANGMPPATIALPPKEPTLGVDSHEVRVDQPLAAGGTDEAPTPVELFVVSLATCVAYYAGRYLDRHGLSRAGSAVHAEYRKADRPPARIASIQLRVILPAGLPTGMVKPLHASSPTAQCTTRCGNRPQSTSRSTPSPCRTKASPMRFISRESLPEGPSIRAAYPEPVR